MAARSPRSSLSTTPSITGAWSCCRWATPCRRCSLGGNPYGASFVSGHRVTGRTKKRSRSPTTRVSASPATPRSWASTRRRRFRGQATESRELRSDAFVTWTALTPRPRARPRRLRRCPPARSRGERMPPARGLAHELGEIPSSRSIASSDFCSPAKPKRSSRICRSSSGNLRSAARTACLRNVVPACSAGSAASGSAKSSPSSPFALAADGLIQRYRRLDGAQSFVDVDELVSRGRCQLLRRRLASVLHLELPTQPSELQSALVNVCRDSNRLRLVGDGALARLPDPPRRVRRELEAPTPVELLDGAVQADRSPPG